VVTSLNVGRLSDRSDGIDRSPGSDGSENPSRLRPIDFIAGRTLIADTNVRLVVVGAATRVVDRGPGAAIAGTGAGLEAFPTVGIVTGGTGLDAAVFFDASSWMR
jgi:hypothetical protein